MSARARGARDGLAVQRRRKEAGVGGSMRGAPLFETLEDLDNAGPAMQQLLWLSSYRNGLQGLQEVMIGYSDSAKDAGTTAACWAQYRAQETLAEVCREHHVELLLFHGRGATVVRGGAPALASILSQPPGSVSGCLRTTEQGDLIRVNSALPAPPVQNPNQSLVAVP